MRVSGVLILTAFIPLLSGMKTSEDDDPPLAYPVADRLVQCRCAAGGGPVCGSDGRDYPNECQLHCVSDDNVLSSRPPVKTASRGVCPAVACSCPKTVRPVCGTDGQTYANDCLRRCANSRLELFHLPPVRLAYRGICSAAPCTCPAAIIPVCGTDGKTYRNICVLQCNSHNFQAQGQPPVHLAVVGACKKEACVCPTLMHEVCASDGETYYNQCSLDCVNRRRAQLGEEPAAPLYPSACLGCTCAAVVEPVCASDGNTYQNSCKLTCENEKRKRLGLPELKLLFEGECGCICTAEYRPICATDHRTKSSACLLRCENRERDAAGLAALGALYGGACDACDCRYCSPRWRPVCGADRRTYWNICRFSCNNDCRAAYGLPPIKKVADGECPHKKAKQSCENKVC